MSSRLRTTATWLKNDFNLNGIPSRAFYHSQWDPGRKDGLPSIPYLIYRFLFTLIFISCTIYILTCPGEIFYVFFTYWNMFTQALYAALYFLYIVWRKCLYHAHRSRGRAQLMDVEQQVPVPVTDVIPSEIGSAEVVPSPTQVNVKTATHTDLTPSSSRSTGIKSDKSDDGVVVRVPIPSNHHKVSNKNRRGHLTCLEKVICILMAVTQTIPFIVAVVYWTKVYKYENLKVCKRISNYVITHSATAIFALIDTLVVAVPARLTHFIFPASFTFIYMLFDSTYDLAGGRHRNDTETGMEMHFIYKELNWQDTPGRGLVFALLCVLGTCVFHTIVRWGVYKLRLKIASRLSKASGD